MGTVQWAPFQSNQKRVGLSEWQRFERSSISVHVHSTYQELHTRELVQLMPSTGRRERTTRISPRSTGTFLSDLEDSCTAWFDATIRKNTELNCSSIFASYCTETPDGRNRSGNRHCLSVRGPCIWCLSALQHVLQRKCMKARAMADIRQARAWRDTFVGSLAHLR